MKKSVMSRAMGPSLVAAACVMALVFVLSVSQDAISSAMAAKPSNSGPLMLVPGLHARFTADTLGCPAEKSLETLQTDANNHDRMGFDQDLQGSDCVSIPIGTTGLVIGNDGVLDPWYRIRLDTNKKALWIDDMTLSGPSHNNPVYNLRPVGVTKLSSEHLTTLPVKLYGYYPELIKPLFLESVRKHP